MRKIVFVLALILGYGSFLFGDGGVQIVTNNIYLYQQGFPLEYLSGYGFSSSTIIPVHNIGSGNPALVSDFIRPSLGISFQYDTKIDSFIFSNVTFQRINNLIPQSGGVVYPFHNFEIGAGFSQKYSGEMRLEFPITTVENPEGTGEYFTISQKRIIYSLSTIASYQFKNLFSMTDRLSVGLQFNLNYLLFRESIYDISAKMNADAINWSFGLSYRRSKDFTTDFTLGLFLETRTHFSDFLKVDYSNLLLNDLPDSLSGNNQTINRPILERFRLIAVIPVRLGFGYFVRVSPTFGFTSDLTYTWWEDIGGAYLDRFDFSHNLMFDINDRNSLSVGFYFSQYNNKGPYSAASNAIFLSGGFIHRFKILQIHLAVADSHLFSTKIRKQTVSKIGIDVNL